MSGFSAEWLALREPVDHRSRNASVRAAVASHFADRDSVRIVDLGCGSGSNLRALAPHLAARQDWRLVDYDPALLGAAERALRAWADEAREAPGGGIELRWGDKLLSVSFEQADLAQGLGDVLSRPADLIAAAAFFDLVSANWIERFVALAVERGLPLYTVLTYDGRETWRPAHPADIDVLAAFHAHQATDKGFGSGAGPAAADVLCAAFGRHGWRVATGDSPWVLGAADAQLISALADGAADAVAETGRVPPEAVASWRAARRHAASCEIGHMDLFAFPERGST